MLQEHYAKMPITEYFNALSFQVMKNKERNERIEKAISKAEQNKSNEGLTLTYLAEILSLL